MPEKCISFALILLLSWLYLGGEGNSTPAKGVSIVKFIPGLPQLISGKVLRGGILLGACLATVAGAILENQRGNDYYEQYLVSIDVDEVVDLRQRAEKSFRARNYYIMGLISVWILHFLDLKFLKNKKAEVKSEVKTGGISIGICYSF
jgi:hypothetical protein